MKHFSFRLGHNNSMSPPAFTATETDKPGVDNHIHDHLAGTNRSDMKIWMSAVLIDSNYCQQRLPRTEAENLTITAHR